MLCPIVELQIGNRAHFKLINVAHSFCRDDNEVWKVDTPKEIVVFLESSLNFGRIFEIGQVESILDDERFIFGRKARLLERLTFMRNRLQEQVSLESDMRPELKQEISEIRRTQSILLKVISAESNRVSKLLDVILEDHT